MNNKIYCPFHKTEHTKELLTEFRQNCNRLQLKVKRKDCPIRVAMEGNSTNLTQTDFTIIPKNCTDHTNWPTGIDLLITKFPITEKEGFSDGLVAYVANQTYYKMNNNSLAFIIISAYKEDKSRHCDVIRIFKEARFNFIDTIIWAKNKYTPTQGGKRLNNVFDYILMFAKGDNYHLNRKGIAYLRKFNEESEKDHLCPGNVWFIKAKDKDEIPEELVKCLITLANVFPKSKLVDPFLSANTLKVAFDNCLDFWGCTSDKKEYDKCREVVNQYKNQISEKA